VPVTDKVVAEFDSLKRLWRRNRWLAAGVALALLALGVAMLRREFWSFWSAQQTGGTTAGTTGGAPASVVQARITDHHAQTQAVAFGKPTPIGYTNSLGMRFVPVPGTDVLFSIWETRVRDYAAFAAANPGVDASWKNPKHQNVAFTPGLTHPVAGVSWHDATNFCHWLTQKERAAGRLTDTQSYRLPTDAEWSWAVGIGELEGGGTPKEKDMRLQGVYPWGTNWPPANRVGNFADTTAKLLITNIIAGYSDGFETTAPVGSFKPNHHGLFDLSGNVWEWCKDWYDGRQEWRVLRGGSWFIHAPLHLRSSSRAHDGPSGRLGVCGFRCVLEGVGAAR
jgi:hypothetical protein